MPEATVHIRRATPAEVDAAGGRAALRTLGLVPVGASTTYLYLFAAGADRAGLPGAHVADRFADLPAPVAGVVMQAHWTLPDGTRGRGKRRDLPAEATLLATRPPLRLLD